MEIKAIIYDLDDTLYDVKQLRKESVFIINELFLDYQFVNKYNLDLEKCKNDFITLSFYNFTHKYSFNDEIIIYLNKKINEINLNKKIKPFPDYIIIQDLSPLRFIVTTGNLEFQMAKIEALGIKNYFTEIYVDTTGKKELLFTKIINEYDLKVEEILIIGDNEFSEIKAGNNLKIKTVQILRHGIKKSKNAFYHIKDLFELKNLMDRFQ